MIAKVTEEDIQENYLRIKTEISDLIANELNQFNDENIDSENSDKFPTDEQSNTVSMWSLKKQFNDKAILCWVINQQIWFNQFKSMGTG